MRISLIVQAVVVLCSVAGSVWLAQSWRREGVEYEAAKARQGGIDKQRRVSEGEKRRAEIIAQYEAEALQLKGLIDGRAVGQARVIEEEGETQKVEKLNITAKSQAYAIDTISGIGVAAERYATLASSSSGREKETYSTISEYLYRTAANLQQQRALIWVRGSCDDIGERAKELTYKLSADRSLWPVIGR